MLSRIRAAFKKRTEHSDIIYLQSIWLYYNGNNLQENDGDNQNDTSSISSVSTNATMDNIPGTGRIIDTYLYQFFGRKLERFIFRISMANLPPDRILEFLRVDEEIIIPTMYGSLYETIHYLGDDASVADHVKEGERIAGLKSLVKQTQ